MFKKVIALIFLFLMPTLNAETFGAGEIERTVGIFNKQKYPIQMTESRDVDIYEGRSFLPISQSSILIPSGSRKYFRMQPGSSFTLTATAEDGQRKVYRIVVQTFETSRKGKVSIMVNPVGSETLIDGTNVQLIIGDPLLI